MNIGAKRSSNIGVRNFGGTSAVKEVDVESYEEEKEEGQEKGLCKAFSDEVSLEELKELLGES